MMTNRNATVLSRALSWALLCLPTTPVFGLALSAHAAPTAQCTVPVCDVTAKITELRSEDEAARFKFLHQINNDYHKSASLDVMANLKDFGIAAKKLTIEMKDEDYVTREATYIVDMAAVVLARYAPVNLDNLVANYTLISGESDRWQILSYWSGNVDQVEDLKALQDLELFGEAAVQYGLDHQDDDYMIREARAISTSASSRLVELNPFHEGIYTVKLACKDELGRAVNHPLCKTDYPIDEMIVLNIETDKQVEAVLLNHELGQPLFIFPSVSVSGQGKVLRGATDGDSVPAEFSVEVDPDSGAATGWIQGTDSDRRVSFEAQRTASPVQYYQRAPLTAPLTPEAVEGTYTGQFGTLRGTLVIRLIQPPNASPYFAATFTDERTGVASDFQKGSLVQNRGVLQLIFSGGGSGMYQKWILCFEDVNGKKTAVGQSYSTITGAYSDLRFEKN